MKLDVAVIFGGHSVEHEISIISALQMIENCDKTKYNVIPVYMSKEQKLFYSNEMIDIGYFKDLKKLWITQKR